MNDYWYALTGSFPIVAMTENQAKELIYDDKVLENTMIFRTKNEAIDALISMLHEKRDKS